MFQGRRRFPGSLTILLAMASLAAALTIVGWAIRLALEIPALVPSSTTAEDGARAQRKILSLYQRGRDRRPSETVTLSEREVNALVSRQLAGQLPVNQPVVRLLLDEAEIAGRLRVEALLSEAPLAAVRDWLPVAARQRPVWLSLHLRPETEDRGRRQVRLIPVRAAIGRLPVPARLLSWLMEPGALRYLRWTLPDTVRDVRVEPGAVIIRVAG